MMTVMSPHASRRLVLTAAALAGSGFLAACNSSSTSDAGPTRTDGEPVGPVAPDLALLLATWERVGVLQQSLQPIMRRTESSQYAALSELLLEQDEVLTGLLNAASADLPQPTPAATTNPAATASPSATSDDATSTNDDAAATTSSQPSLESLRTALAQDLSEDVNADSTAALADSTDLNLALLISINAQHAASAIRWGQSPTWPSIAGTNPATAAELARILRPLIYALEVVTATSSGDERVGYQEALDELSDLTDELVIAAGRELEPAKLGYGLPEAEASQNGRRSLLLSASESAAAQTLSLSAEVTGEVAGIAALTQTLSLVTSRRTAWGATRLAFPGMTRP